MKNEITKHVMVFPLIDAQKRVIERAAEAAGVTPSRLALKATVVYLVARGYTWPVEDDE